LNFSAASNKWLSTVPDRQIKARVFEVPGYGGCLVTEEAPNLDQFFCIGEEILAFEGGDELVETVKSLLAHPEQRDTIARRGFERVSKEHTYDRRFDELFRELLNRVPQRPHRSIDWQEFESAARHHAFGPILKIFRSLLVVCAALFCGRRRALGRTRMVFEVSWRLVGSHTYSASGWPGRMFYKES
jgi:spore maturation protein CgeB